MKGGNHHLRGWSGLLERIPGMYFFSTSQR